MEPVPVLPYWAKVRNTLWSGTNNQYYDVCGRVRTNTYLGMSWNRQAENEHSQNSSWYSKNVASTSTSTRHTKTFIKIILTRFRKVSDYHWHKSRNQWVDLCVTKEIHFTVLMHLSSMSDHLSTSTCFVFVSHVFSFSCPINISCFILKTHISGCCISCPEHCLTHLFSPMKPCFIFFVSIYPSKQKLI